MQDENGNPIPNDDLKKNNLVVRFEDDDTTAFDVTDVWIRQDGRWINLVPADKLYKTKVTIEDAK